MKKNKTKAELIQMVDRVMKASACSMDFESLIRPLESEFAGVDIGRLIFDPPSGRRMTAEEIVDAAMAGEGGFEDE